MPEVLDLPLTTNACPICQDAKYIDVKGNCKRCSDSLDLQPKETTIKELTRQTEEFISKYLSSKRDSYIVMRYFGAMFMLLSGLFSLVLYKFVDDPIHKLPAIAIFLGLIFISGLILVSISLPLYRREVRKDARIFWLIENVSPVPVEVRIARREFYGKRFQYYYLYYEAQITSKGSTLPAKYFFVHTDWDIEPILYKLLTLDLYVHPQHPRIFILNTNKGLIVGANPESSEFLENIQQASFWKKLFNKY